MSEVFSWPEGQVLIWTGTADATGIAAFAENTQVVLAYGWENYRTLDSAYHDRFTGQRADYTIAALYTTTTTTLQTIADTKTGVHWHFKHSAYHGSAGTYLYSGTIDSLNFAGQKNGLYQWTCAGHANAWSAY
jgi:hypothetical protein